MTDPTPAPAPTPAPTPAPAPAGDFDWGKAGLSADNAAWVGSQGFKSVDALLTSHRDLQRLTGGGLDKIIQIPGDDKPESWNPIYDKLGRPKDAKGYEIPMPQAGGDEKLAEWFRGTAHELGLSVRQTKALVEKWNGHMGGQSKASADALAAKHGAEIVALKTEWGGAFDTNAEIVDKAAAAFGMSAEHLNALKSAMGPAAAMKFLHGIGSRLGTDGSFVSGEKRSSGFGGMTPQQAQAAIAEKRADNAFVTRYAAGDAEARREMERLHRMAYPDA